ncbi:MAG: aminotransferase class V-fold PLP-dependent enzyme [bacterium]
MYDRREFLGALGRTAALGIAGSAFQPARAARALEMLAHHPGAPEDVAADEALWFEVQQAFTVDRSLINLNNGGVSPSPAIVQSAMKRHLDFSNNAPVYTMWQVLEPQREGVRKSLAAVFGCSPEEIALTRNASESLQICQLGFDFKPGDEVLTTSQDYPRMITTWQQRERRDKIKLKQFSLPVPCENPDEIVSLFEKNVTPKTKLILMCHMINLTGQILPVQQVVHMARKRNIPVIVDGAHAFAHFDFTHADLDCDYYATSLHKWLFAPHGTGMLYVRKDRIAGLWPMMAAPEKMDNDVRKFEEIGTHPAANYLAIAEALTFHHGLGAKRKAARLIYLRDRWANRLMQHGRIKLNTSLKPGFACGLANVQVLGLDSVELTNYLWHQHRMIVTPIKHPEFEGLRITPSVYTTVAEIDRFAEVIEQVLKSGLPKT